MILKHLHKSGIVISIFFLFSVLFIWQSGVAFAYTGVSSCQILGSSNEEYILTADIVTNIACFDIVADNITFNGNGSRITFNGDSLTQEHAIEVSLTGTNAHITNVTIDGRFNVTGINIVNVVNVTVSNVTFTVGGTENGYAILASSTNNLILTNISILNHSARGITLQSAINTTISNIKFNQTRIPINVSASNFLIMRNMSYDDSEISPQNDFLFTGLTNATLTDFSRGPLFLNLNITGISYGINITNFSISRLELGRSVSNLQIANGLFTQNGTPAILISNNSDLIFENVTFQNATTSIIEISSDVDTNASITGLRFTNVSYSNFSSYFINKTSYETNVSIEIRNSLIDFFDSAGNLFIITYTKNYGAVNLTQPINGSANFSQMFQIRNSSIIINDTQISALNQSMNISFFNLLTNFSRTNLLVDGAICLPEFCQNISEFNQTTVHYTVDRAGNFTLVDTGEHPAHTITGLTAVDINNNNITWSWVNPTDLDFNGTLIFVDNINVMNLSKNVTTYNSSYLSHNTQYTIKIQTIDYDLRINTTLVALNTTTLNDTASPSFVSELSAYTIARDFIFYNWTLPTDVDYAYSRIEFDNITFFAITNRTNFTINYLHPNTTHNLTITSFDINGNSNVTSNITYTTDDAFTSSNITGCGTIVTSGDYILATPLIESNYSCIFILSSNVLLDGNGSSIHFSLSNGSINSSGIWMSGLNNITLRNFTIVGNSLLNVSSTAIYANMSSSVSFEQINVLSSTTGISLENINYTTINSALIANTNSSMLINLSPTSLSISNSRIGNTSYGFKFTNATQVTLTNITVFNSSILAINVSSQSHVTMDQFNWTLPTNTTSAWLLDARNTSTFTNSSIVYGEIMLTNFSAGNLSMYTVAMSSGSLSINKRNASAVSMRLNETAIDSFNFTQAINLSYNGVVVNVTDYPYLNLSATITFYDMYEGTPVYKFRNGLEFNESTTPHGSSVSSLTARNPIINTSSLDGNYSLRGYTIKLLYPTNNTVIVNSTVEFLFSATPALNRTLIGCNLSLNGTLINQWDESQMDDEFVFDYDQSDLIDDTNYTWKVFCLDSLSAQSEQNGNFSVDITPVSSDSGSSGSFGISSSGAYSWANTYFRDKSELAASFNISLKVYDGVRLLVNNKSHHVGILSVTATTATINVSSKPQQATLKVNETRQFVLDDNETGGINVTLTGVSVGRANLTITPTSVPLSIISVENTSSLNSSLDALDSSASQNESEDVDGYTAVSAGEVMSKFVATKGLFVVIAICGVVLFCGIVYYFFLVLRYKQDALSQTGQLASKKGILAEFLFPFMPGGEYWEKKKRLAQAVASNFKSGPRPQDIERYAKSIIPLVPPKHADHIEARLRLGNPYSYIEFELIQNGYTREQAKSLVQQFQLDKYVKNCIYAGATNEQVSAQLQASGWSTEIIAKIFRPPEAVKEKTFDDFPS